MSHHLNQTELMPKDINFGETSKQIERGYRRMALKYGWPSGTTKHWWARKNRNHAKKENQTGPVDSGETEGTNPTPEATN